MPFHVLAALPLVIKFGHNFAFSFHIWYTRTTICNEIDMSSSTHKINALNILANYNSQITFQTPKFPFFQNFNRVFTAKLSPATTKLTRHKFNSFMNPPPPWNMPLLRTITFFGLSVFHVNKVYLGLTGLDMK